MSGDDPRRGPGRDRDNGLRADVRAQVFTLEGLFTALIMASALLLGIQAVDTDPFRTTTDERVQSLDRKANDVLRTGATGGWLSTAVRCYTGGRSFDGGRLTGPSGPNPYAEATKFTQALNRTFDARQGNYRAYFSYWNDTTRERDRVIVAGAASGRPGPESAVATRQVTLYDSQSVRFTGPGGSECGLSGPDLEDADDFFVPNINDSSLVYNVVEVQVVVW